MVELTVAHVSGLIAAGIFLLQHFIPSATSLILAGLLRDENTAATWTQVARSLHSTYWPLFVGADPATAGTVSRLAQFEALMRPLTLGIVAVAAVITPLGLYDTIVPAESTSLEPFKYTRDTSPFGFGTPPRSSLGLNRFCGTPTFIPCPGSNVIVETNSNGSRNFPFGYDNRIPSNLTEAFQSGLKSLPPTVSSIFDIEYRSYGIRFEKDINNGSKFLTGAYRQAGVLALNDAYDIVEGLIVDTKNGGVGFRNHTTPSPLPHGSEWSEDLLFVEPHTQCLDTNLTMDFRISPENGMEIENLVLTDRGGFVDLNTDYPQYDRNDTQANPDLLGRAYKAAYLNNALTMVYLNVSNPNTGKLPAFSYMNSEMNKTFPMDGNIIMKYDSLLTSRKWGSYLDLPSILSNFTNSTSNNSPGLGDDYPNPFNISTRNFTTISTLCHGAGELDYANITNIAVMCGTAFGAPRLRDGSQSLVFEPGSEWTVPLYSCASAARAVIKTVDFRFNGTDGLKSLSIRGIHEKRYSKNDDKPLWGVEDPGAILEDVRPLWGLVSDEYKGRKNISVLQKESLWLPGFAGRFAQGPTSYANLPGVYFHTGAFEAAYEIGPNPSGGLSDYSGKTNIAMFAKWQEYSDKASTTAKIINLVWTDVAANAVVGTKGWISRRAPSNIARRDGEDQDAAPRPAEGDMREVPVYVFQNHVKYKLRYAIPAFVALLFALAIAATTCVLCVFGSARPSKMRKFLFHTSAGRIMATLLYPGQADPQAPSKEWNRLVGGKNVTLSDSVPRPMDPVMMGKFENTTTTGMDAPLLKDSSLVERLPPPSPGLNSPNTPQTYRAYSP
ncbi:hypothetical protein AJ79_04357 [Helicocarpus griseus UAMH5409]|uniref:Uncharacterized protein n=1 Tax=Helicocarpus griseus UAMH5409 TaxID=1447875 RepID=A0A2B7XU44_9EURO|nr:hypothetical protein AJ79_04357 [Helicocarpus griseus UAMH5409]